MIGSGRLACACLDACLATGLPVECVEPEAWAFSALRNACRTLGVEFRQTVDRVELRQSFSGLREPTLVVSAYNSYLFPEAVRRKPNLLIVNYHDALLPRHRGRNAPAWAIFEMDICTGVTWHEIGHEVDRGSAILQEAIDIPAHITALGLTRQTLVLGARTFAEILPSLLGRTYAVAPIPEGHGESYHRGSEIPNEGVLDLGWPVGKAYAFLRALDYGGLPVFPPPRVRVNGADLTIVGYRAPVPAEMAMEDRASTPGENVIVLRDARQTLSVTVRVS